jgi:RNA polymerase sigma factor (sigma-70 family)
MFLFVMPVTEESNFNEKEYITILYEKYGRSLWKYAYVLSQNNEIASDLVSITFLKVIEKMGIIKKVHRYKIKSYLMSMVKNTYINYLNKEKLIIDIDNISEYSFTKEILEKRPEMKPSKKVLEKLKSLNFLMRLKNDYHRWKEIVARELSEEKFENWEIDSLLKNDEKFKSDLKGLDDKYGSDMKMGEILKNEL